MALFFLRRHRAKDDDDADKSSGKRSLFWNIDCKWE